MKSMPKKRLCVTLSDEIIRWVDGEIGKFRFASRSHAIEYALRKLLQQGRRPTVRHDSVQ